MMIIQSIYNDDNEPFYQKWHRMDEIKTNGTDDGDGGWRWSQRWRRRKTLAKDIAIEIAAALQLL